MKYILSILLFLYSGLIFAEEKPNIVFILVDDLGWVDVSTGNTNNGRGSSIYQTPNIDRIADEGMSFTYAYTQQNCAPTRASLISGLYPTKPDNGVYNVNSLSRNSDLTEEPLLINPPEQQNNISTSGVSIFDMLKSVGYTTGFVGKDHATGASADLGVDLAVVQPSPIKLVVNGTMTESYYFALNSDNEGWSFKQETMDQYAMPYTENYVNSKLLEVANGNNVSSLIGKAKHLTDAMGDFCEDYIADNANKTEPFFLYVPFHAVHFQVAGRPDLVQKYLDYGNRIIMETSLCKSLIDIPFFT